MIDKSFYIYPKYDNTFNIRPSYLLIDLDDINNIYNMKILIKCNRAISPISNYHELVLISPNNTSSSINLIMNTIPLIERKPSIIEEYYLDMKYIALHIIYNFQTTLYNCLLLVGIISILIQPLIMLKTKFFIK